jgi:hypothetical protein
MRERDLGRTDPAGATFTRFFARAGVLLAVTLMLPACNILGPAGYFIHGPEKIKAQHELKRERRTIVFIDDRGNKLPRRSLRYDLAAGAQDLLISKAGMKNMIDARSAILAAGRDRRDDPVSIEAIGLATEAEVVIYATVESFSLSPDGSTYSPSVSLRVKVIDVTSREREWPEDREGMPLNVQLPPKSGTIPQSLSEVAKAESDLSKAAGQALAQMFYTFEKQQAVSKR